MDQSLVEVEYERLSPLELCRLGRNDRILLWNGLFSESAGPLQLKELLLGEVELPLEEHLSGLGRDGPLAILLLRGRLGSITGVLVGVLNLDLALGSGASFFGW